MTSLEVSDAVEETIQHELQNLYAAELGVSSKTDYDWMAADINVFMYEVTEDVEYMVPAGYKVKDYVQCKLVHFQNSEILSICSPYISGNC